MGVIDKILTTENQNENDEMTQHSKHLEMIFKEIYSKNDIELKTEVNALQINTYSKALVFADDYNSKIVRDLVNKQMQLSVSKNRGGRKEFTTISSNINNPNPQLDDDHSRNMLDKLLGKNI